MKVVKKKQADGHVHLDATASTSEVSNVLNQASEQFCAQMNIQPVRGKTPAADTAMTGHLHLFLSELISRTGEVQETDDTQDYLIHAVEYIRENYVSDVRVEEIASKVGVSRSQLYRAFTQEFGMSPHQYIKQYRIKKQISKTIHKKIIK